MSTGGNYGHNGGRQQRKRPRDYDDDQYRRPRTHDVLEKLKRDLVNLADPGNVSPIEDIKYVARKIAIDFETSENQDRILTLLRECLLQLSIKTCQYAAVVSLAAAQNKDFGLKMLEMVANSLSSAISRAQWRDVKLFLRLVSSLSHCLKQTSASVIQVLSNLVSLLDATSPNHEPNAPSRVAQTVLLTLPYLFAGLRGNTTETNEQVIKILERLNSCITTTSGHEHDFSTRLLNQCKVATQTGWDTSYLPQFPELHSAESRLESFEFPVVTIPANLVTDTQQERSKHRHIFTNQTIHTVPKDDDVAASVFHDLVTDILDLLVSNRKDAARFLIDLESYLPANLFVLRGTPLDKIPEGGPTWKAEDIVVEAIFSELFALPTPAHKPVYYHSLLTELCKLVPQAIAPTFGRAIRAIYYDLPTMEPELVYRFWDWFSHHLSNFGFNWKWQEWISDLELPPSHPKSVFIREAVEKEAELSYNQRIKTTLPAEYHKLIPDEAPGPNFPCNNSESPYFAETTALLAELSADAGAEQLAGLLTTIRHKAVDQGTDPEEQELQILVASILQLGHQSFSHALNTIERNLLLLQTKCNASTISRRTTVAAVMAFWSGRPFIASTLLQKLLNYRLVSPISILQYLLLDSPSTVMTRSTTWELFRTTIEKVNTRVTQVRARLDRLTNETTKVDDELPDGAETVNETSINSDDELEKLRKTWVDVQEEQREVFIFIITQFSTKVAELKRDGDDAGDDDNWTLYWTRGMYKSILRRNKAQVLAFRDELPADDEELLAVLDVK